MTQVNVLANIVGDDSPLGKAARAHLALAGHVAAPDLVDVETVAVLRKRWIARDISDGRFEAAIDDLLALPIIRYPTGLLMVRAYELRANVAANDAAYVALAEGRDCTLLTANSRLSRAPAITCTVEVFAV